VPSLKSEYRTENKRREREKDSIQGENWETGPGKGYKNLISDDSTLRVKKNWRERKEKGDQSELKGGNL